MSKRDSDLAMTQQAVAAAKLRGDTTTRVHFHTFESLPELAPLVTAGQLKAFQAMDHRLEGHPCRVAVKVAAVEAALAANPRMLAVPRRWTQFRLRA